jgi:23S rRNA (cytosine1962-C5)-methyltransferase
MQYASIRFWASLTPFRHVGVFPEQSSQWDWICNKIRKSGLEKSRILNLFGYTGIISLLMAKEGAFVTHIDASKKAIAWARENQALSDLSRVPIRWILEDAVKFVERESRRGNVYDGIILDPPKFGRGPKGEVWKLDQSFTKLLHTCRFLLSKTPIFVIVTTYAANISSFSIRNILRDMFLPLGGQVMCGELLTQETGSKKRVLSHANIARWER